MKSDRFISTHHSKPLHLSHLTSLTQNKQNQGQEHQVPKLYKKLVMEPFSHVENDGQMCYNSLKSLNHGDADGYGNGEQNKSYEYLNKFGINLAKLSLGPVFINKPDRILQALSLTDNFYLNLLDCSQQSVLAVGLSRGIYLWKPSGTISRIRQSPDISCIQWNPIHPYLMACGNKNGGVQIWDAENNTCLAEYEHHLGRIGALAWQNNPNSLLSGSRDSGINSFDLRTNKRICKYKYHNQQICTLKVQSFGLSNGGQNFASGSNDKNLAIWNTRMRTPVHIYKHSAAVKGLDWHPAKNGILASGAGTQDKTIKIWNINSNEMVKSIDTGSQVCNLMYLKDGENLVSTHGFNKFQTNVWDSKTLIKQQTLIGHTKRVLYLTAEPDGETIITGAGDQTIRFWKIKTKKRKQVKTDICDSIMTIR